MKPSLRFPMVSGTLSLLAGLTFSLMPTPAHASRPDGYTDNGIPYYYAYPDEGEAEEESDNSMALTMPPDQSMPQASDYGYDDSYVEPYYAAGGWDWGMPGAGIPFGPRGFFGNNDFNFRNGKNFMRHDRMHNNFHMHSPNVVMPHHSIASNGRGMMGGRAMMGGVAHGGGGGHR